MTRCAPERILQAPISSRIHTDDWAGFPASGAELLCFICDKNIRRVVLLAGNSHLGSVSRVVFAGSDNDHRVIAFVSSGFYAPWPFANQRSDELVVSGPVDMGLPGKPCVGTLYLDAISTASGYALLRLQPTSETVVMPQLAVSLRSGSGSKVNCTLDLP